MRKLKCLVFGAMFSLVFSLGMALAADTDTTEPQAAPAVAAPAPEVAAPAPATQASEPVAPAAVEPDMQWLWGEVKSVDAVNKELTVNYLDYESDAEKEVKILTDDKTNFENTKALADIKVKDTVSVDYVLTPDNKYLAKLISIEKPEEMANQAPATVPAADETVVAPAAGQ